MSNESVPQEKSSIDPKKIGAWITLGGTIYGLLKGLTAASGSNYNPIDTAFIYITSLLIAIYLVGSIMLLVLAAIPEGFGKEFFQSNFFWAIFLILLAVIAIPVGISYGNSSVQRFNSIIVLTFYRFVGLGFIVLSVWIARWLNSGRDKDQKSST